MNNGIARETKMNKAAMKVPAKGFFTKDLKAT